MLTTFMALVAVRQETVTECFGAFRVKEAYSAEETPAAQRKAKVTMTLNAPGVLKNQGGGAAMQEEGLEVRDVTELARSVEKQLRDPAVCSSEVMERLRIMARSCVVAARMLANEERNGRLSRGGAAP